MSLGQLGSVALKRFEHARAAGEAEPVLPEHLNASLGSYRQALGLTPADDHQTRASIEHQLGNIYNVRNPAGARCASIRRSGAAVRIPGRPATPLRNWTFCACETVRER